MHGQKIVKGYYLQPSHIETPVRHFFGQVSWNCFSAGPSPKLFVNPKNHRKEDIIQIGHATKHSYM
jgi:hypothetical protein